MLSYSRLSKTPSIFRSFAGLEVNEFNSICSKVEEVYPSFEEKRLGRKDRKREIGAGHPFKLSIRDRLLMLLIYYRLYLTSTLEGYLFDLGQTNVLKDIRGEGAWTRAQRREGARPHTGAEEVQQGIVEGEGRRRGAHDIEDEEISHHGRRIQEQAQKIRCDDGYRIGIGQIQDIIDKRIIS